MQANKELDYDTIYNEKAEEVVKMIVLHFGKDIKFLSKKEVLPDRPERDNIVGVILKFELYENVTLNCGISTGNNITFEKDGVIYSEVKYMTWNKAKSLGFKNDDDTILEKIAIVDKAIQMKKNGEEIVKVDIED